MLHSLAHALITEIALDCGYPASSLKERIYAFEPDRGQPRRCGILLYAVSLGAEGTLGGLVQSTRRLSTIIDHALERLTVCSNDPVCADHEPGEHDGRARPPRRRLPRLPLDPGDQLRAPQ